MDENQIKKEIEILNKELVEICKEIEDKSSVNIINEQVNHTKFGKGVVINLSNNIIEVEFDKIGAKKFNYPEVFIKKFLSTENVQINENAIEVTELYTRKSNLENKILQVEDEIHKLENTNKVKEIKYSNDISKCMLAVLTGQSYIDDIELNLYYDKVKNGCSNYGYLGLYRDKSIVAIGKIENIVKACYIDEKLYCESVYSAFAVTENQKERIVKAILNGMEKYGWDNLKYEEHYYFLVEKFIKTDFIKVSDGALWGRKRFDLCKILDTTELLGIEEIAKNLNNKTWE